VIDKGLEKFGKIPKFLCNFFFLKSKKNNLIIYMQSFSFYSKVSIHTENFRQEETITVTKKLNQAELFIELLSFFVC